MMNMKMTAGKNNIILIVHFMYVRYSIMITNINIITRNNFDFDIFIFIHVGIVFFLAF